MTIYQGEGKGAAHTIEQKEVFVQFREGELYYQVQQYGKIKKFIQDPGRIELPHN